MRDVGLPRLLLWSFLGFLVLTAALAITVVLADEFTPAHGKILATSATIAVASVGGMVCATFRERTGHRVLGAAGIGIVIVAAGFVIAALWSERSDDTWGKVIATLSSFAGFTVLAEVLALVPLAAAHAWLRLSTLSCIGILFALVAVVIWHGDDKSLVRLTVVVAVVVTLQTLSHPIFWALGRRAERAAVRQLLLTQADADVWTDADGHRYSVQRLDIDVTA